MAKRLSARVRPKNQITLPQRLVTHIGLKEGDFVEFEITSTAHPVEPGAIVLRPKRLTETPTPLEPVPPLREEQEFPGVKTAIAELKKRLT
ncbi:MAG: AbrB/MazE/SpoVT family DNA-binding domain-containing protein [bacterium]|nr:AbrB/MazE/SpoVT family DNA-binding domain-containing protein [bacterium]